MLIRTTQREFKQKQKTFPSNGSWDKDKHTVIKQKTTYWILFIPIFSTEKITHSNII